MQTRATVEGKPVYRTAVGERSLKVRSGMAEAGVQPRIQLGAEFEAEWPQASALATACVLNLGYLAGQMEQFGQELVRRYGVSSPSAFNVLTILAGDPQPLQPSTIATRMVVTRGTMTALLDSLERQQLVRRLRHGRDGRMRLVEITAAGVHCVEQIRPQLHTAERRWLSCLTAEEQQTLLGFVARLQANAPTAE